MSRLTEPLRLGDATAPACLLFGPHVTNLGADRGFGLRHVAYYARRAQGDQDPHDGPRTRGIIRYDWHYTAS